MKRFIDLRTQIYCDEDLPEGEQEPIFAFFCTCTNSFEVFNGSQIWESWSEFEEDYDGKSLDRYKSLCPDWVFTIRGTS